MFRATEGRRVVGCGGSRCLAQRLSVLRDLRGGRAAVSAAQASGVNAEGNLVSTARFAQLRQGEWEGCNYYIGNGCAWWTQACS